MHDASIAPLPSPGHPSVSIVVPVVRAHPDFRTCLESLARLSPAGFEVIVAVDGGDAAAASLAREHGATVVALPEQRGPAAARNAGARAARGEVLFFVDADVAVPSDAVGRVQAALAADPSCDGVIGSYDTQPAAPNFLSQCKNLAHHFVHQASNEEACTFWTGCGAIRRDRFIALGGLDESFERPSVEDIDLGMRVRASGGRIRLLKSLQVTHLKRWTPISLVRAEVFDRAVPWTQLILEAGRMPNDLNLRWTGRVSVVLATLLGAALVGALAEPRLLVAAAALAGALLLLDLPLLRFFGRVRGPVFAARAVMWQWVHYWCSAAGFTIGLVLFAAATLQERPAPTAAGEQEGD